MNNKISIYISALIKENLFFFYNFNWPKYLIIHITMDFNYTCCGNTHCGIVGAVMEAEFLNTRVNYIIFAPKYYILLKYIKFLRKYGTILKYFCSNYIKYSI